MLACLLHDIGVAGFIRCDHGYWGAQLIEPYVDGKSAGPCACTRRCGFFLTSWWAQVSGHVPEDWLGL